MEASGRLSAYLAGIWAQLEPSFVKSALQQDARGARLALLENGADAFSVAACSASFVEIIFNEFVISNMFHK